MSDLLDTALELIDLVAVFPCGADKKPLTKHGFKDASRDADQIQKWFSDPRAKLIGIPTGRFTGNKVEIIVIDVDVKEGKAGLEWLKPHKPMLQGCRCHVTPSKGAHYIANRGNHEIRSSGGAVHDGIDIRADGGYICVGPGYRVHRPVPWDELPELPPEVIEAIQKRHRTWDTQSDTALEDKVRTAAAFHEAVLLLIMRDALAGLTPKQASGHIMRLLADSVAAEPLHPRHKRWQQLQGAELDRMIEGAYDKARVSKPGIGGSGLGGAGVNQDEGGEEEPEPAQEAPGEAEGLDQEEEAPEEEKADSGPRSKANGLLTAWSAHDLVKAYQPGDYVVEGMIQRGYLYALTAITGSGKTSVTLTFAAHVADGRPIGSHKVTPGVVLYLAGENITDVTIRVAGIVEQLELTASGDRWLTIDGAFDLKRYHDQLVEIATLAGGIALVVVDTAQAFQSACGMADQNSNSEMAAFGQILRRLTTLPGNPAVIVNAHPPKRAAADTLEPAGGGAFINELDANLTLWDRGEGISTFSHTKMRGADFQPFDWAIEPVTANLTKDREGRSMQTVIARVVGEQEAVERTRRTSKDEDALLEDILNWKRSSHSDRARRLEWTYGKTEAPNISKVTRCFDRLAKDKLVRFYRDRFILTELGRKEAGNAMGEHGI